MSADTGAPEPSPRSRREKTSLVIRGVAPLVAALVALYLLPESLEPPARWALAITAGTLAAWVLRPVPLAATSIPVVFALGATGAASASGAVAGFGSSATLLLVAGFMMASAIDKTPLARRLTYLFLLRVPPNSGGVLGGLLVALAVAAVFVPSTVVRAVAFLPVVVVVAGAFARRGSSNGAKRLMIGLAFGATLGGIAIFPAAIVNVLAVDLVVGAGGERITYFGWFALTWPIEALAFLTLWGGLVLLFPTRDEEPLDRTAVADNLSELGPTQSAEWRLAGILLLTAVLWMLEPITGWHPSVPAFLAVSLLAISPLRVISWDDALDISWGSVFMFGASLSLALTLRDTGAADWVGEQLFGAGIGDFARLGVIAGVLAVAVMMLVFQLAFAGSTPAAATLLPILLAASGALRLPAEVIGMTVALAGLATFVLPSQAMSNLVTYQTGLYKARDLLKIGLLLTLVFLAILAATALVWWRPVGFLE
ncbi:MAG: SLC13 family permease [Actinomycetota bacterium]|nr:SLC13 family permease [Actinomycetota bacterium]